MREMGLSSGGGGRGEEGRWGSLGDWGGGRDLKIL